MEHVDATELVPVGTPDDMESAGLLRANETGAREVEKTLVCSIRKACLMVTAVITTLLLSTHGTPAGEVIAAAFSPATTSTVTTAATAKNGHDVARASDHSGSGASASAAYLDQAAAYLGHGHIQWEPGAECPPSLRFSTKVSPACETPEALGDNASSCGGIGLRPGECMWPSSGQFRHHPNAGVQVPRKLWGGEPTSGEGDTLCQNASVEGRPVGDGDERVWETDSGCKLVASSCLRECVRTRVCPHARVYDHEYYCRAV